MPGFKGQLFLNKETQKDSSQTEMKKYLRVKFKRQFCQKKIGCEQLVVKAEATSVAFSIISLNIRIANVIVIIFGTSFSGK